MNTEIRNAVDAADEKVQYDEGAKRLLSQKIILAHILVKTVDEFKGMNPKDVVSYIEGEPYVGVVPVEPGLTNVEQEEIEGQRVTGMNTESSEINEGLVRFDIIFYVRMKDGLSQIIVNVEAQKDEPGDYDILNRAIFYVCRMVSSQKERDFTNMKYDEIKRVVSIWICMNMDENSLDCYQLTNEKLLGSKKWQGKQDMLNIVLIGLAKELPEYDEGCELHRLLGTLLSDTLKVRDKLDIIENEYHIPLDTNVRKGVNIMCNLGEGIEERAMAETKAEIIMNMHNKGYTLEQISEIVEFDSEQVEKIIEKNHQY